MTHPLFPPKLGYSIQEFAFQTTLCRAQIYNEIAKGRLHVKKAGRRTIIPAQEAQRWLDSLPLGGVDAPQGSEE